MDWFAIAYVGVCFLPTMRETFIIRTEWWDAISELSIEDRAEIFRLLFVYHSDNNNLNNLNNNLNNLNNLNIKLVWKLIEPNLKRNITSYDKRCDTSRLNGALGGRPPDNKTPKSSDKKEPNHEPNKPNKPNVTLSVSDSVTVSDSVSVPVPVLVPVTDTVTLAQSFYDAETLANSLTPNIGKYKHFISYLFGSNETRQPLAHILRVPEQLTYKQFEVLLTEAAATGNTLSHYVDIWANNKSYSKGKVTIYLTLKNWIAKDKKKFFNIKKRGEAIGSQN